MSPHQLFRKSVFEALGLATPSEQLGLPPFSNVTSDSRKVKPGSLFVAIKGEVTDGHLFIESAIKGGAQGIIFAQGSAFVRPSDPRVCLFEVADPLVAFRALSRFWRHQFSIPVFGVGGSEGKTTTKELLTACVQGRFKSVIKTEKSQNGFLGIPITLMELGAQTEAAVIEIGIDEMGAMKQHEELVQPDFVTLTSLGPEHLLKLGNLANVVQEESLLLSGTLRRGGKAVLNLNDPEIAALESPLRKILSEKGMPQSHLATFRITDEKGPKDRPLSANFTGQWNQTSQSLAISHPGGEFSITPPLAGSHNRENLLNAISLALLSGVTPEQIKTGLKSFTPPEARSQLAQLNLSSGRTIRCLCDYYNANPTSMRAAFNLLQELSPAPQDRVVVCLADMRELGPDEETFHRELAQALFSAQGLKPATVFLFGEKMAWLHSTLQNKAKKGDLSAKDGAPAKFQHFASKPELIAALKEELRAGDLLLIKGSRGMAMEEVKKGLSDS